MQLIIISLGLFLLVLSQDLKAQINKVLPNYKNNTDTLDQTEVTLTTYEKPDWKAIDINFLNSYYTQDGNNSAVTGGIGTEHLTDFTQKITISIPTSEQLTLQGDVGYDYYSSASTDQIDNIRSSDSSVDMRVHGNLGISYALNNLQKIGLRIGGSTEYDYVSVNGGLTYDWNSKSENTSIGLGMQAFIDKWTLYYPSELRGQGRLVPTDKRQSYNGSFVISQVLNKKMQLSLQVEATYMTGLLSTPFHRVFFQEQDQAKVESLPSSRLKIPIGLRLNTYLTDWLISRLQYRYYTDDWGIAGHTFGIELPVKINRFFSVYPMYRYHTQTAADYFLPIKEHSINDQFYSSDFDLSELDSHSYGLGLSFAPADGIGKLKFIRKTDIIVSSIDLKYSHYTRSTGLGANIVSLGVGIVIR